MKANEQVINVPLKPEVKRALVARADANGRATGREAARIIEQNVSAKEDA